MRGEPVVGVILNPAAGCAVWASEGDGTFRDGTRVRVSSTTRLADAVVIASRTEISRDQFEPYDGWFAEIRPVGSIAWKLACIASGEGDLNISVAPKNEWDVCAGDVLVREAGGIYVGFDRTTRRYNQAKTLIEAGMAAGSPALVDAFLAREGARVLAGESRAMPRRQLHWAVEAQELLDAFGIRLGIRAQPLDLAGIAEQRERSRCRSAWSWSRCRRRGAAPAWTASRRARAGRRLPRRRRAPEIRSSCGSRRRASTIVAK